MTKKPFQNSQNDPHIGESEEMRPEGLDTPRGESLLGGYPLMLI
mgnify:FL=1